MTKLPAIRGAHGGAGAGASASADGVGAGQALRFEPGSLPGGVEVRCYDEDAARPLPLGVGSVTGLGIMPSSEAWAKDEQITFSDARGKPTGKLEVRIEWDPEQGPRQPAVLCVTVIRGHRLGKDRPCGKYCTVRVGTVTLRTRTVVGGGRDPVWLPVAQVATPRRKQGFSVLPELYDAAGRGDVATVLQAIKTGRANLDERPPGRHGNSALHRAASNGHVAVVRELIRAKADINSATEEGWTPTHCACHAGQRIVVKMLLHLKADIRLENGLGKTALDYARLRYHNDIARILETHKAPAGEIRAPTPVVVVKNELGKVSEREFWVAQLLRQHKAESRHPCMHKGVMAELLRANRNRGIKADNHYDVTAASNALHEATDKHAFGLPELVPSVVLWRSLVQCVTRERAAPAAEMALDSTDPQLEPEPESAETLDQEWRHVLDRGLYRMDQLLRDEAQHWRSWARARSQMKPLAPTLGERLAFPLPALAPALQLRCWDEKVGRDDLIGTALVRPQLLEDGGMLSADVAWKRDMNIELVGAQGSVTGSVRVRVDWDPKPVAKVPKKCMRVYVCAARKLHTANLSRENSPYCEVTVVGSTQGKLRAQTVKYGGASAGWGFPLGSGEALDFELEFDNEWPDVTVAVWDEDDGGSKDELIGQGPLTCFQDSELGAAGEWRERLELRNAKRKVCGELYVVVQYWDPEIHTEPEQPLHRRLRATIFSAQDLPKKDTFGHNDPFVTVTAGHCWCQKTQTISGGGSDPKWADGAGESLDWSLLDPVLDSVELQAWDEDTGRNDLIGSCKVDTSLQPEDEPWKMDLRVNLMDSKGKEAGTVHILLQSWDARTDDEPELPPMRLLRVTVVEAKGLPRMDLIGATDPFVECTVDGTIRRTSTAQDAGADPVWGSGAGETFEFPLMSPARRIDIRVFDDDPGENDDLIGKGVWTTVDVPPETAWMRDEWVALRKARQVGKNGKKQGNRAGQVRIVAQWLPGSMVPVHRILRFTVFEATDIPKVDLFGKTDPYIVVEVDGDSQKTTTIDDGGSNPEWGGGHGEALTFDRMFSGIPTVMLRCFDEDVGSADDEVGFCPVDLHNCNAEESFQKDQWLQLLDRKGKKRGTVRVQLEWLADPPEPVRRGLTITVYEARGLPKMDLVGSNDPYVTVTIGSLTLQTSTVDGGGASPKWLGDQGEILECFPVVSGVPSMLLSCWDEDADANDLIGSCAIKKCLAQSGDEAWTMDEWVQLRNKGKESGEVRVCIDYDPSPPEPVRRGVKITVLAARDLPKMDLLGANDPYVKATVGDVTEQTSTVDGGGADPEWNGEVGELLEFYPMATGVPSISLTCWDEDESDADDLIGTLTINNAIYNHNEPWSLNQWLLLRNKGKAAGELHISVTYDPEPPEPVRRGVKITVLEARGLPKMDLMGANDPYVTVCVGEEVVKTRTIDGGGDAPSWDEGETFEFFPVTRGIPSIELNCYDEDVGPADDLIGTSAVSKNGRSSEEDWALTEWLPLHRKGKESGEVRVSVEYDPTPPDPERRGLRVTIVQARHLPKMDLLGANDPYVTVSVLGQKQQTTILDGGGEAPMWGDGQGELLYFELEVCGVPRVEIACFDSDGMDDDDEIGLHTVALHGRPTDTAWQLDGEWVELRSRKGKLSGEVQLSLEWVPHPPIVLPRRLQVTIVEATDLPKMDLRGKNDVYCQVLVKCGDEDISKKTTTIENGGANPQWGFGSGEVLTFDMESASVPSCEFKVFDEDVGRDDYIGGDILLPNPQICLADQEWSRDEWVQLSCPRGRKMGRLHVQVQWEPNPIAEEGDTRMLTVLVYGAAGLVREAEPSASDTGVWRDRPTRRTAQVTAPVAKPYITVSAHNTNLRTVAVTGGMPRVGEAHWGEDRSKSERLAYLHRQQCALRHRGQHVATTREGARMQPALQIEDSGSSAASTRAEREEHAAYQRDLWEFAHHFGIDPETEAHLLWIAETAMGAKLPAGWEEVDSEDGSYFCHRVLGLTSWEHPLDSYHIEIVARARDMMRAVKTNELASGGRAGAVSAPPLLLPQ